MALEIKKNSQYGESSCTIIGVTRHYGRPQFIVVDSDEGSNPRLKFPGLRFRGSIDENGTLEDSAAQRFEEQTGMGVEKMLGLRAIMPTRSRHGGQWSFRNIFVAKVDPKTEYENDGRGVYLVNPGEGISGQEGRAFRMGHSGESIPLEWVVQDNRIVAEIARNVLYNFNWETGDTSYLRRIPCLGVRPLASGDERKLGCGLAVSSIMLLYRPEVQDSQKIILLKRKGDKYPGYAGGKIETPETNAENLDPISCCAQEGSEEFGFPIIPRALLAVAHTATDMPEESYYNGIVTYSFVAEPQNSRKVKEALQNPSKFLEGKMEGYVVEDLGEHRDRVSRGELRMPDNLAFGNHFFGTNPGKMVPLTQIISSGID